MARRKEESVETVIEDVTFILNELRLKKLKLLEETKLNVNQEKILEDIEKDLETAVTKLGLLLHPSEL